MSSSIHYTREKAITSNIFFFQERKNENFLEIGFFVEEKNEVSVKFYGFWWNDIISGVSSEPLLF